MIGTENTSVPLFQRCLNNIKTRRDNVLNGNINSIPTPFYRFRNDFIGVEQSKYYIVTSFTKIGKTLFASYLFLYNTILYAYRNPGKIKLKIFYYPLEETPEQVTTRFLNYLLFTISNFKYRITLNDLLSSKNEPLDEKILSYINNNVKIREIMEFFQECVTFSDSQNPSGVWFECQRYAKDNGTIYKEQYTYKDELGEEKQGERFSHYEMNDKNEYRIIFFDHMSLVQPERGMDLRATMTKLSEYFVLLRNRYKFTIVGIQQQVMTGDNLDAFKSNKIRPSIQNAGDAKTVMRDVDMCIGLFSPYKHELKEYLGYDVSILKDNLRFAEVLINRSGQSNGIIGLYFDGATNYWKELPLPNSKEIENVYRSIKNKDNNHKSFFMFKRKLNYIK